ncbi:MAG: hypothetical protein QXF26_06175 [Candidatus Bathyarchaeia archaeon]
MGVLSRSVGALSFLLLMLSLFLPWFYLSSSNLPSIINGDVRPIEVLSNFYNDLQPVVFFVLIPLLFVCVGAIYCLFRPEIGGRISLTAILFLLSMVLLIYYFEYKGLSELLVVVADSLREGFFIALVSSLASSLTGLQRKGRSSKKPRGTYAVYTGEEEES